MREYKECLEFRVFENGKQTFRLVKCLYFVYLYPKVIQPNRSKDAVKNV